MTTLLDRAKALMDGSNTAKAAALAIVPLAAGVAQGTDLTLTGGDAGLDYAGSYSTTIVGTPSTTSPCIDLEGGFGPLSGDPDSNPDMGQPEPYRGNNSYIRLSGDSFGPTLAGNFLRVAPRLTFTYTGGAASVESFFISAQTITPFQFQSGQSFGTTPALSGTPIDLTLDADPFTQTGIDGYWYCEIRFAWSGYGLADTLSVSVDGTRVCLIGAPAPCPVDIDDSGIVDADDIFAFLQLWFQGPPGEPCFDCVADWDGDQTITADDIFAYIGDWFAFGPGNACP